MATKSSIHIKPCNIASSEAHNRRTAEYMRHIGESRIYVVPELSTDNEQWINPDFGSPDLRMHYDNIRQMVKEKTGRAMQEKERERKGKNGKIVKIAGCSPIREGVLLVRSDTTLADVRKFGEECQRRWGITPLQIFLHKDEGHWLNGQPEAEDRESFKVGDRWFKPNYHAHIVFDWMNHETGKSRKLNDEDMATMQTLASDILLMERGQAKAVTGKEHLERNDFIIEKQKAELQRIEETKRHKEQQVSLAEQELKQVKAEIRTDKLKSAATDVATAITSSVGSLFGSGKLKELEHNIEQLHQEIANRDAMTGVKNKTAYQEAERLMEDRMRTGRPEFAVVVLDINGLKYINDTYGHDFGDMLIVDACRLICKTFKHSPVYRIGGDEFAVILENDDLKSYPVLLEDFEKGMAEHNQTARPDSHLSIARGIAVYNSQSDLVFANVFKRADDAMYQNKAAIKAREKHRSETP